MITDINSEDRLVQKTFAAHPRDVLGWGSLYAHNEEAFGPTAAFGYSGTINSQLSTLNRSSCAVVSIVQTCT